MIRSMTFLDQSGDTSIIWDEDTDEKMLAIIEAKMAEGFVFFIVKPSRIPFMPPRQVRAKSINDVRDAGSVLIRDEALEQLFRAGDIATTKSDDSLTPIRKAANANEVITQHSVAIRPARGG